MDQKRWTHVVVAGRPQLREDPAGPRARHGDGGRVLKGLVGPELGMMPRAAAEKNPEGRSFVLLFR